MLFLIFNLHYFCRHGTEMRASRNHSILQINITGKKNILIYAIVKSIIHCPSKPVFNNVETLCSKKNPVPDPFILGRRLYKLWRRRV
jgi:hypothetical protein